MNRRQSTLFALLLMSSFLFSALILPNNNITSALDYYAYITAAPNPVGVGQQVIIVSGFTLPTSAIGQQVYKGWTVTATKPDGTNQTLGTFNSDPTGSFSTTFVPDTVGEWKIQAYYPGGYADYLGKLNASVPPSYTNVFTLTVQQEQLAYSPGAPLPTEYWQFPIYGENYEWRQIAGNWLQPGYDMGSLFGTIKSAYVPYTTMPNSSHILWTKAQLFGGMVGGESPMSYYTGSIYRGELQPPVAINGRLYYNAMEPPRHGWYCVDIHTGETIWYINGTYPDGKGGTVQGQDAQITLGQVLTLDNFNWHGGIPYLWSTGATTWAVWDAWTGALQYTIVNAPSKTTAARGYPFVIDPLTGDLITFNYDARSNTLVKWSSLKMLNDTGAGGNLLGSVGRNRPVYNINWTAGVEWNVTLPKITGGLIPMDDWVLDPKDPSIIIATNQTRGGIDVEAFEDIAISTEDGHIVWQKVRDEGTWELVIGAGARVMSMEHDIYLNFRKETREFYAYRASTGEKLWVTQPFPSQWAMYLSAAQIAYNKLYTNSYDGKVWALDINNGDVIWEWGPVYAGLEAPYGHYPFYGGIIAADGKILVAHGEHSANSPLYRNQSMFAIDAESGETIWEISGVYQTSIVVNGYILGPNGYDGKLYTFGKGPTAITLETDSIVTPDSSIVLKGMVTDISPGSKESAIALRFPEGVPAVSDESMTPWMEYVYMQQQKPNNITGVEVSLSVLDANGNYREIGTTTSDEDGFFTFNWIPDIPGGYKIYANFAGSDSYWPSHAVSAFVVESGQQATPTQAPISPSITDYILPAVAAIIIAIAIVGALIILMLRRRT